MRRRSSVRFPLREKQKSTDELDASERFASPLAARRQKRTPFLFEMTETLK